LVTTAGVAGDVAAGVLIFGATVDLSAGAGVVGLNADAGVVGLNAGVCVVGLNVGAGAAGLVAGAGVLVVFVIFFIMRQ
jgi:hypothetical protein